MSYPNGQAPAPRRSAPIIHRPSGAAPRDASSPAPPLVYAQSPLAGAVGNAFAGMAYPASTAHYNPAFIVPYQPQPQQPYYYPHPYAYPAHYAQPGPAYTQPVRAQNGYGSLHGTAHRTQSNQPAVPAVAPAPAAAAGPSQRTAPRPPRQPHGLPARPAPPASSTNLPPPQKRPRSLDAPPAALAGGSNPAASLPYDHASPDPANAPRTARNQRLGGGGRGGPEIVKCCKDDCTFSGPRRTVREHEEDRHLIFAPGREPKPWSGSLKPIDGYASVVSRSPRGQTLWAATGQSADAACRRPSGPSSRAPGFPSIPPKPSRGGSKSARSGGHRKKSSRKRCGADSIPQFLRSCVSFGSRETRRLTPCHSIHRKKRALSVSPPVWKPHLETAADADAVAGEVAVPISGLAGAAARGAEAPSESLVLGAGTMWRPRTASLRPRGSGERWVTRPANPIAVGMLPTSTNCTRRGVKTRTTTPTPIMTTLTMMERRKRWLRSQQRRSRRSAAERARKLARPRSPPSLGPPPEKGLLRTRTTLYRRRARQVARASPRRRSASRSCAGTGARALARSAMPSAHTCTT